MLGRHHLGQAVGGDVGVDLGGGDVGVAQELLHNPQVRAALTQDNRFLAFSCLQGFRYWPSACRVIGREELITDERFSSHEQLAVARDAVERWRTRLGGRPDLVWVVPDYFDGVVRSLILTRPRATDDSPAGLPTVHNIVNFGEDAAPMFSLAPSKPWLAASNGVTLPH